MARIRISKNTEVFAKSIERTKVSLLFVTGSDVSALVCPWCTIPCFLNDSGDCQLWPCKSTHSDVNVKQRRNVRSFGPH